MNVGMLQLHIIDDAQHSVLKANKCANSKEKGLKYFDLKANESAN